VGEVTTWVNSARAALDSRKKVSSTFNPSARAGSVAQHNKAVKSRVRIRMRF
jgi:hypothetical protein